MRKCDGQSSYLPLQKRSARNGHSDTLGRDPGRRLRQAVRRHRQSLLFLAGRAVTDDFETGFAGGYKWRGPDGLRDFLAARAGFADEQHDVDEVLEREDLSSSEVRIKTRLKFSLRQPAGNELFTGTALHIWLLRRDDAGRLRIAAQIVDGFASLNDNGERLFATPNSGLNR